MYGDKFNIRHALILSAILAGSWVLALLLSKYMLSQMYEGQSFTVLNDLLTNKDSHPLDYYIRLMQKPIAAAHILLAIIGALFITRVRESALLWLSLLVLGDTILLIFSELYDGPLLNIVVDWSIPEWYQYFKELSLTVALFILYRDARQFIYVVFAAIAFFLLMDDAFKYHESVGHYLAPIIETTALPTMMKAAPNFIGEVLSLLPLVLILPFGAVSFFSADKETRLVAIVLLGLLVTLFVFGVVVDFLGNSTITLPGGLRKILYVVEDFGEMITMSIMLSYVASRVWYARSQKILHDMQTMKNST
jgi:hypothetical protein